MLGVGAAASWVTPVAAQTQPPSMPGIGFPHSGAPGPNAKRVAGLRDPLFFAQGAKLIALAALADEVIE